MSHAFGENECIFCVRDNFSLLILDLRIHVEMGLRSGDDEIGQAKLDMRETWRLQLQTLRGGVVKFCPPVVHPVREVVMVLGLNQLDDRGLRDPLNSNMRLTIGQDRSRSTSNQR